MEWTLTKEQMPTMCTHLILTIENEDGSRYSDIGYMDSSNAIHLFTHTKVTTQVVAWMHIPEPYLGS